jgi:hypothetical protein
MLNLILSMSTREKKNEDELDDEDEHEDNEAENEDGTPFIAPKFHGNKKGCMHHFFEDTICPSTT